MALVGTRWAGGAALTVAVAVLAAAAVGAGGRARASVPPRPAFEIRGVVEGFYGPPWSHEARLAAFAWMGSQGLNTYVNAPKDDPYQRANWRDPYPAAELADLLAEVEVARTHGVAWVPNLSPAFPLIPPRPLPGTVPSRDVCFSCPEDLDVVASKFDPFFDAGARTFMISFDDVQDISTHPEDASRYGAGEVAYGEMNRDLLNAVHRRYQAKAGSDPVRLLTVLPWYSGTTDPTGYFEGLRSDGGLDDGIDVFWTGAEIASRTVAADDAAAYAALVGREKVAVWDNYPVNDYAGNAVGSSTRLFLGPYQGRAPDLDRAVLGILANPMNEATASRVALATMADYLAAPASYDPEASWRSALASLAGGDASAAELGALAALAENSRSSPMNRLESPVFAVATQGFLSALDSSPFWEDARAAVTDELAREEGAGDVIRARFPVLAAETGPWLDALTTNALAAQAAVELLVAQRPGLVVTAVRTAGGGARIAGTAAPPSPAAVHAGLGALAAAHAKSASTPRFVHGDRAAAFVVWANAAENRLDEFVAAVETRTGQWLPTAPLATTRVEVTVDGVPVPVASDGSFDVHFATAPAVVEVVARDGAGGTAGQRLDLA